MITDFGKFLRKMRLDRDETGSEMAKKLGMSVGYLSRIERGDNPLPRTLLKKVCDAYPMTAQEAEELHVAFCASRGRVEIPTDKLDYMRRMLAVDFSGELEHLTPSEVKAVWDIVDSRRAKRIKGGGHHV